MKISKIIILLILINIQLFSQKHDYHWYTGNSFGTDTASPPYGVTHWNFNTNSLNPQFSIDTFSALDFIGATNIISDFEGNYLFSYNGDNLINYKNLKILNSDLTNEINPVAFNQMAAILPDFDAKSDYLIFYKEYKNFGGFAGSQYLYKAEVNIDSVSDGFIKFKKKVIIKDTLHLESLSAVKHANGRDWWILIFEYNNDKYYSIRVSQDKEFIESHKIGRITKYYYEHATFSPDGNYLALSAIYPHIDSTLSSVVLFEFDRNTGKISNPSYFDFNDEYSFQMIGVCFSPNSKYLYISRPSEILQVNVTDPLHESVQVAEYDGYTELIDVNLLRHTKFGYLNNAPDGRIYGTTSCCLQPNIYVINKPNLEGKMCDVIQHAFKVTMQYNLPSFPNYRLGPIEGSISDTLGIDNIPVAEFRYDQDTLSFLKFEFTNLSFYEPVEWWWNWGDGSPVYYTNVWDSTIIHHFPTSGKYTVCLKAKNEYGENTICKELSIGTSGTFDKNNTSEFISIYPNPFDDLFIIQLNDYQPQKMECKVFNLNGVPVISKRLYEGSNLIDTKSLPAGIYLISIFEKNKKVLSSKMISIHD